jgi:hypothetical protein
MENHRHALGINPIGFELGASNLGFQLLQKWITRILHLHTSLLIQSTAALSCNPSRTDYRDALRRLFYIFHSSNVLSPDNCCNRWWDKKKIPCNSGHYYKGILTMEIYLIYMKNLFNAQVAALYMTK